MGIVARPGGHRSSIPGKGRPLKKEVLTKSWENCKQKKGISDLSSLLIILFKKYDKAIKWGLYSKPFLCFPTFLVVKYHFQIRQFCVSYQFAWLAVVRSTFPSWSQRMAWLVTRMALPGLNLSIDLCASDLSLSCSALRTALDCVHFSEVRW